MRTNALTNRLVAIMAVLLLILSFNVSLTVSATFIDSEDDGVWFDDFRDYEKIDNVTSIDSYSNCDLNSSISTIKLKEGANKVGYDYSHPTHEDNIEAWDFERSLIYERDNGRFLSIGANLILNPNTVATAMDSMGFTTSMYGDIESIDDDSAVTRSQQSFKYDVLSPIQYYRFTVDQDPDFIKEMDIKWYYGNYDGEAHLTKISMYVWTYGNLIPQWQFADTIVYNDANIEKGTVSLRYKDDIFVSDEGAIDFLIIGTPLNPPEEEEDMGVLRTDYVNVSIELEQGYLSDGHLISSIIEPAAGKFNGWESLIWEGTKPSSNSNIKIRILDENSDVIKDFVGNEEGFTTSPIDLTSLDVVYTKIRIKASLHSDDIAYTPSLFSWGVLWQTKEGFYDSFSYNYRTEESYGVENDGGNIIVSEFYGDWPILGKNPANTRSYNGLETNPGSNITYWYSKMADNVGGGFRSPVISNGRVYIGSNDSIIYAFNKTVPKADSSYVPVDESSAKFPVDSSLAVSDGTLIVATSGKAATAENKIYALNSMNLSEVKWEYDAYADDDICFSASPTIANGRVYVTTCSGLSWSRPFFTQLSAKITSMLNSALGPLLGITFGYNNKLVVLDIHSGSPIWKPVSLPASSYSTPAVDDGIIFVGCDNNVDGGSLFAFDEYTGDEIWNASIGLIGKSSPVVADTPEGKAVFVLAREEELFSLKGDNKIIAVSAETGEHLWNFTIGENTSGYRSVFIKNRLSQSIGTKGLMFSSAPISSVAVHDNKLFAMSPQGMLYVLDLTNKGEFLWSFDAAEGIGLLSYFSASPVVVDDVVYIASEKGKIFALDINSGNVSWDFVVTYPHYPSPIVSIYASPVVSDGLTFISVNELDLYDSYVFGRVLCIGNYTKNTKGQIISTPIHVQKGKWWDVFNATTQFTEENNTITFSILDENNNPISGFEALNGDDNDISGISTNSIKLSALLEINNETEQHPILEDWGITWTTEAEGPVFIDSSFEAGGIGGWINKDLPECSIEAYDVADGELLSGLDTDSARYELEYLEEGKESPTTEWFDAVCDGELGVKQTRIRAKISTDLEGKDISKLLNITFEIKDLAGNENTSEQTTFKIDTKKPTSYFTNDFESNYTAAFDVTADAEDTGDAEGPSGVNTVTLKYRNSNDSKNWGEWTTYPKGEVSSPFSWEFKTTLSGYYQLVTIATDKASNKEKDDDIDKISDTFLFDMNKPEMKPLPSEINSMTAPFVTLNLSDDFELESVFYQPDDETVWKKIEEEIGSKTYETTWTVPQEYWDTIEPGEEQGHYIFFKVTDLAGNELITTEENTPYIVKNESIIDFYVDLSDFAEMQWDDKFTITATFPDDFEVESIKLYYRFSADSDDLDDIEWKEYGEKTSEPYEWEFVASDGNGYYEFRTITTDTSGNPYQSEPESVKVSIFPTSAATVMIFLAILLLFVTIFVLRKMKKKNE